MNNAAISIFRYRRVPDTIGRKLMLFTAIWGTTYLLRWWKGKGEFVFFKTEVSSLSLSLIHTRYSARWWNLEFLQTEEIWDQQHLGQQQVPTATAEQIVLQIRTGAEQCGWPKPAQGYWGGCLATTEGCWHAGLFALGQSYYLLNLSSDLALNLPRCKNKTQNCSTDFSF